MSKVYSIYGFIQQITISEMIEIDIIKYIVNNKRTSEHQIPFWKKKNRLKYATQYCCASIEYLKDIF